MFIFILQFLEKPFGFLYHQVAAKVPVCSKIFLSTRSTKIAGVWNAAILHHHHFLAKRNAESAPTVWQRNFKLKSEAQ